MTPITAAELERWKSQDDETLLRGCSESPDMAAHAIQRLIASLEEARAQAAKHAGSREHTQRWYASHYGKLEDWARKVLPEPYRNQFFSCIANGTYHHSLDVGEPYVCKAGFTIVPTNYFRTDTAEGQLIVDQTRRAEEAEAQVVELQKLLEERGR